ncbi:MAG: ribonuclease E/G [Syntrophotaleaceae bacterium]
MRLRNLGGLIIVDFIDMEKEAHWDKVYLALEEALRPDRAKTNILKISELGLVEMTRKRVRENWPAPFASHARTARAKATSRAG